MPKKARFYSAKFNTAHNDWVSSLPASSKDNFIYLYGHTDGVRLHLDSIKNMGFYAVDLNTSGFTPYFYIPELRITFNENDVGYHYLYEYFPKFINSANKVENMYYKG
ncbi:hypothetical protein NRA01_16600 [Acinetobacter baumannii]|uniref:hypothetical protein n=1 Tax=Acinetobacter baumannii TaxID=470 RepID=UPI0002CE312A|nr:hypothetical protein [Acinetobacter baumannii]ENW49178.1 hypothetical protein F917_03059 [Acinetobacter baumannii NIPH 67]MDC4854062.1 hypothetical protein [Acinetobacter baumannii]MDC4959219.1 hypothetical protein [Acinetobacter baumannii]MDC5133460.1 hypothetical protein [Acinetobacter baumannii]MDC5406594.1 hypothetical protein [Acinetobacter baumannii]